MDINVLIIWTPITENKLFSCGYGIFAKHLFVLFHKLKENKFPNEEFYTFLDDNLWLYSDTEPKLITKI